MPPLRLSALRIGLTFVTGLLDAVTYLSLGHVFAANQTGNIIVLGFALVGSGQISVTSSLASLAFSVLGSACSGWACRRLSPMTEYWFSIMSGAEAGLLGLAAVSMAVPSTAVHPEVSVSIIAFAMGMRNVTVQRVGIGSISTTVLTSTLATLAGEALQLRIKWEVARPRLAAIVAMLVGAAGGALLVQHGAIQVVTLATGLTAVGAVMSATWQLSRRAPALANR